MDAATALVAAAKGMRAAMGRFASPARMEKAGSILQEQAEELAKIGRLEAPHDTPAAERDAADLIVEAARRRLRQLGVSARDAVAASAHADTCEAHCRHPTSLLAMADEDAIRLATAAAREIRVAEHNRQALAFARQIAEQTGKLVIGGPNGISIMMPVDDEVTDEDDGP